MSSAVSNASQAAPLLERQRHREMLIISLIVVIGAYCLDVRQDGRVAIRRVPALVLPPTCGSREWFGVECPGCGLTRSIIFLARGDWHSSLAAHRLGWLLAAAILLQFPYRLAALWRAGSNPLSVFQRRLCANTLIVILIANWGLRLLGV